MAKINANDPLPLREFDFLLTRPTIMSMESRTAFAYSVDQALDRLNDFLGVRCGMDGNVFGRGALLVGSVYTHWLTTFFSHEIAHRQQQYNLGGSGIGHPDFTSLGTAEIPPHWVHPRVDYAFDPEGYMRGIVGGLTQQELNAKYQYQKDVIAGESTVGERVAVFMNDVSDIAYHASGFGSGDIVDALESRKKYFNETPTRTEWIALSVASAALSMQTWESLWAAFDYMVSGERSFEPFAFDAGPAKIYPPHFSLFAAPHDFFMEAEVPVAIKGWVFFLDIGGATEKPLNPLRLGATIHQPAKQSPSLIPAVDPSLFLNFDEGGYRGVRAGLDLNFRAPDDWILKAGGEVYYNDYLANDIQGYGKAKGFLRVNEYDSAVYSENEGHFFSWPVYNSSPNWSLRFGVLKHY